MEVLDRYATVGSLAGALRSASVNLREVQRDVDGFLAGLYPGWKPLFPPGRGWRYVDPDILHVYGVEDSPAATAALHRAGFRSVTAHNHRADDPCGCRASIADPGSADPAT